MCSFSFTVFVSAFMLFPTAPFHILDIGGTNFTAGLFLGLLTYGSAVSAPFTGALADRLGKRRTLVVASLTISGLSVGYALAPSTTFLLLIVPLHGVFWSGMLTASAAYLLDLVPESRRAEGVAYWGLSTVGAIAIAPTIAFWIYDHGGWVWLCGVVALLNVAMAGIALCLEEHATHPRERAPGGGFIEWRVLIVSITLFLFSFGYGGITSFVALYAEASGTPNKGAYFTALALVILVTRPLVGTYADRIGHKKVFVPCLALAAAGIALLLPGGSLFWLITSAIVFGLGFGSAFPVYTAHVMQRIPASRRGAAFGSMLAAFDTGIGTGSMALGYIIETRGYTAAFSLAAILAAMALPYFLAVEPRLFGSSGSTSR
jgi:MFS family permease